MVVVNVVVAIAVCFQYVLDLPYNTGCLKCCF